MAYQWPSNPTVGERVIGPDGQIYEWDGVRWIAIKENYSPYDIDGGDY